MAPFLLMAGCLARGEWSPLAEDERVSIPPGGNWSRPFDILIDEYSEVRLEVQRIDSLDGRLFACIPLRAGSRVDPTNAFDILWNDCTELDKSNRSFEASRFYTPKSLPRHGLVLLCSASNVEPCQAIVDVEKRATNAIAFERALNLTLGGAFLALLLGIRILMDRWDRARIREYVTRHGFRVLSISWRPGIYMDRGERRYRVDYEVKSGEVQSAIFKTGFFTGVWTDSFPRGARAKPSRDSP